MDTILETNAAVESVRQAYDGNLGPPPARNGCAASARSAETS